MITSIYKDLTYNDNRPQIQLLLQTSTTKELRISFLEDQIMKEHSTPFPIVVHIVEGKIEFGFLGQIVELSAGDMISLDPKVPHDLKALEKSIVRLSLHTDDSVERVNNVAENK